MQDNAVPLPQVVLVHRDEHLESHARSHICVFGLVQNVSVCPEGEGMPCNVPNQTRTARRNYAVAKKYEFEW